MRKAFPYCGYETLRLRRAGRRPTATSFARYLVRVAEMRESVKICRQALERITPTGPYAAATTRAIVPPPKDQVYTEMEALIQHFLIYSQGFTVPAGEAYVPVEGPRGEQGFYVVSDGTNRPWRVKARSPSLLACQALPKMIVGGLIADVIAVIGSIDVVMGDVAMGDVRSGEFSPEDGVRRAPFHRSARQLADDGPAVRLHAGEPRALRGDRRSATRPSSRRSAILPALYLAQHQQGYVTANAIRHVAEVLGCTPADVEDVASYYTMFYTQPVGKYVRAGLPHAVVRAARRRTGHRGAGARSSGITPGETDADGHVHADRGGVPGRVRSRAGRDGQRPLARVPAPGGRRDSWSRSCARAAKRRCPAAITCVGRSED